MGSVKTPSGYKPAGGQGAPRGWGPARSPARWRGGGSGARADVAAPGAVPPREAAPRESGSGAAAGTEGGRDRAPQVSRAGAAGGTRGVCVPLRQRGRGGGGQPGDRAGGTLLRFALPAAPSGWGGAVTRSGGGGGGEVEGGNEGKKS